MKADSPKGLRSPGDNFYIGFLYGDVPDESEFLRTARSIWLEIKSDDVEEMSRKILESSLVRKLEVPDPHLYFQAKEVNASGCWPVIRPELMRSACSVEIGEAKRLFRRKLNGIPG
jgi:hypothetical protein